MRSRQLGSLDPMSVIEGRLVSSLKRSLELLSVTVSRPALGLALFQEYLFGYPLIDILDTNVSAFLFTYNNFLIHLTTGAWKNRELTFFMGVGTFI